ncbi:MAG: HAD family phosphatase, partial [Roseburia sp.]|nr:HAD family phosphatase [Roseburia sp.]
MVKGIIFDMDGVMIDSERQSNYGWLKAAEEEGITMPMRLINIFKGAPAVISKQHFDDYFHGQADYWETRKLRTKYVHELRETEGIPVKKGLYELLEYSRDRGIKCAVATSTQRDSAYKTLHLIGAWEYLSAVAFGDEVKNGKPAPDIFLKAGGDLELEPSECIVIEDSINGIKAGYNAGIRVVHVPDTIMIDDDIRKLTSYVCDDLNEVINVIERWNTSDGKKRLLYERSGKRLDRCALKYAFIAYAAPYNVQEDKIRLKIEHTYRVAGLCEQIAKSLGLCDADID